jgi:hypothetical protein
MNKNEKRGEAMNEWVRGFKISCGSTFCVQRTNDGTAWTKKWAIRFPKNGVHDKVLLDHFPFLLPKEYTAKYTHTCIQT